MEFLEIILYYYDLLYITIGVMAPLIMITQHHCTPDPFTLLSPMTNAPSETEV